MAKRHQTEFGLLVSHEASPEVLGVLFNLDQTVAEQLEAADRPRDTQSESGDSGLGLDLAGSTVSISSSLAGGVEEIGRRYHKYKEDKYLIPCDKEELDRLDFDHHLFHKVTTGQLYHAPLTEDPPHVLDIGAGTGIWAIEFGELHRESQVVGVDLAPYQPDFVPPNVRFEIDDIEDDWTWAKPFDYIHMAVPCGTISDIPKLLRHCFENTTAGGWLEIRVTPFSFTSQDGTLHEETALYQWGKRLEACMEELGHEIVSRSRYKTLMHNAGYIDVHEVDFTLPSNIWPKDRKLKEIGGCHLLSMLDGLEAFSLAPMTRSDKNGMSYEAVQVFLAEVRKDLKNPKIHAFRESYIFYGRKP